MKGLPLSKFFPSAQKLAASSQLKHTRPITKGIALKRPGVISDVSGGFITLFLSATNLMSTASGS